MNKPLFFYVPSGVEQFREDIQTLLQNPAGRRVFRRMFLQANVMGTPWANDARSMEHNEGMRSLGLWFAAAVEEAMPGEFARLLLESAADRLNDN